MTGWLRREVLAQADHLISETRAEEYGDAGDVFTRIADLWSAVFAEEFTAADVAVAMILVKLARVADNPRHFDSWVDIAGYAALGAEVAGVRTADGGDL